MQPYNQPSIKPVPKIQAVAYSGAIVTGLISLLALTGVIIPDEITKSAQDAVTGLFMLISFTQAMTQFLAGYLRKDKK